MAVNVHWDCGNERIAGTCSPTLLLLVLTMMSLEELTLRLFNLRFQQMVCA
jgi:hypothetical protein